MKKDAITLVLPTADVFFRTERIPSADPDEIAAITENLMLTEAPLEPDEMVFSHETIATEHAPVPAGEEGSGDLSTVLAAAAPVAAAEKAREAAGVDPGRVARVDVAALALARALADASVPAAGVQPVLSVEDGRLTLMILSARRPVFVRSVCALRTAKPATVANAVRLAFVAAGAEGPVAPMLLVAAGEELATLQTLAAPRECIPVDPGSLAAPAEAAAARTAAGCAFNLFPAAWSAALEDRSFRRRFMGGIVAGAVLWALLMLGLYGYPALLKARASSLSAESAKLAPASDAVNEIRERIRIIDRYSDRTYSALEILREAVLALPEGITLTGYRYDATRKEAFVDGATQSSPPAYEFDTVLKDSPLVSKTMFDVPPSLNRTTGKTTFTLHIWFGPKEGAEP